VPTTLRSWLPPALGAAVFVLVLVAAGTLMGDWALRAASMSALVDRIEASEQAMSDTQTAVTDALASFEETGDRTALDEALRVAAAQGRDEVASAGREVERLLLAPWQRDVVEARSAYLAHNRAWEAYLAAASTDPVVLGEPAADIERTWVAAEPLLRAAVPMPDPLGLAERVDAVFAEDPEDQDPGTAA
jgi:hypothetical protein